MNLNEIHYPENADAAERWAAEREFGLRYDSYRECLLRGLVITPLQFVCDNPEQEWIHSMRAELLDAV